MDMQEHEGFEPGKKHLAELVKILKGFSLRFCVGFIDCNA